MKVALVPRSDSKVKFGGDVKKFQIYESILRRRGVDARLLAANEIVRFQPDIIHVANIDAPYDSLSARNIARTHRVPLVLSTIHHPDAGAKILAVHDARMPSLLHFGWPAYYWIRGAGKEVLRSTANREVPSLKVLQHYRRARRTALTDTALVLPMTESESRSVRREVGAFDRSTIVPNGVTSPVSKTTDKTSEIAVVGRIERRKNQLAVARALAGTKARLVFAGAGDPSASSYVAQFAAIVERSPNMRWLGALPEFELLRLLRSVSAYMSFSTMECVSQADLEAASSELPIAVTKNSQISEYFDPGSYVQVDPSLVYDEDYVRSIATILPKRTPVTFQHRPSWDDVVDRLQAAYRSVL